MDIKKIENNYRRENMGNVILETNFKLPNVTDFYKGKVRDVYTVNKDLLVMVATDRISAFDVVLPRAIPYKGQVLNQIASRFLDLTSDICPNWKIASPDSMVTTGHKCDPFAVEMIIRGYLTGSSWRTYKSGKRNICGVSIPDGMREHQQFEKPIVTPTTKATEGHDEDISKEEILSKGIVSPEDYALLEEYTFRLFQRGTEIAAKRGLILVDTKYEFGKKDGKIYLIDEIHTPDSSRYFYADGYQERFNNNEPQRQLSKEFVRQWLMENGFQGKTGQQPPEMTDEIVENISNRYIELYEHITGEKFIKEKTTTVLERVENNILHFLQDYHS
jgi:phosphoribosylaminoimidazole-succinocarboxamide synthase